MATREGTWAYRERFEGSFARTYFRRLGDRVVSSIGAGTYLGDPTDETDASYHDAIVTALESGVNVVDTAINYRCQRSERVVGRSLADADVDREGIFVSTKGGFVPFDGDRPDDPGAYVNERYLEPGLIAREDLALGSHCIAPDFIDDQFDRSRSNLDLETIDLYYVHNPETQLQVRSREELYDQLEATFTRLEERAAAGELRYYGVATWNGLRVHEEHQQYLSLGEIIDRARAAAKRAGTTATHFRAVQLPFNVVMADAFTVKSQESPDGRQNSLQFAREAGLSVMASASLAQGRLAEGMPAGVKERLQGETTAQRALNFARSAPGVTCALVGMGSREHVAENVAAGRFEPLGANAFDAVFE